MLENQGAKEAPRGKTGNVHVCELMDPELTFSQHLERLVNKANRLLGPIRRSFDYLDCDTMKFLFVALV